MPDDIDIHKRSLSGLVLKLIKKIKNVIQLGHMNKTSKNYSFYYISLLWKYQLQQLVQCEVNLKLLRFVQQVYKMVV